MPKRSRLKKSGTVGLKKRLPRMLKGKGGLIKCPACGSSEITAYDRDAVTPDLEVNRVRCDKCDREFAETWRAIDWEEVE